ncbi:MAG: phosphoglucosamine mutase [Oscillospiraceae bacterium]|nr:phosphoglucosamine mutase [Oscillospiraceae bacterium]MBQ4642977.1 phosphoglucosamine mutase [Oscillospiraceae bacterium]
MGRIFGTDGVRGIANKKLDVELAIAISRAAGMIIKKEQTGKPKVIVGRDTRLSGTMLEAAVAAGLSSVGCDVELLGVVPTPAVAYLVTKLGVSGGVMITASHNPFEYNGIKYFGSTGFKLTDEQEAEIESIVLDKSEPVEFASADEIGKVEPNPEAVEYYIDHISGTVGDLSGIKIAVDCANGASYATAKKIFAKAKAEATFLNCEPDGTNVNRECGSLFTEGLGKYVKENGFDIGVAFDGDADRCLAVDENGELIDGDMMMAILAKRMLCEGKLYKNILIPTVMSNMGLYKFAEEEGISCYPTKVGDRYVLESLLKLKASLGGEQSGHIILPEYMTTGDGELSALKLIECMKLSGKKASELKKVITVYPQVMVNIEATPEMKAKLDDVEVKSYIDIETLRLEGDGRILVRPSGTEPLIRIMIEGRDKEVISALADECAETLKNLIS